MTTIGELLDALAEELAGPGVPPARAVARDLIAGVLQQPRFWPSAHRDDALDSGTEGAIRAAAARLREGMPIQYAIGRAAFRHLTLAVDRRVLIPRSETELLVDIVLGAGGKGVVADVGTGSGAIALALAAEGDFAEVHAIDSSADALEVARANLAAIPAARRDRVRFHHGESLVPLQGRGTLLDTIVSNPPYISREEAAELPRLVREWEPAAALFADREGMAVIEALVPQAAESLRAGGLFAMEVDSRRADRAAAVVRDDGRFADIGIRPDLTGRPRFVAARRKER